MRPPYSSCTAESGCEADLATLGYHVTYFNVDTDDYNQDDPSKIQTAKNNFRNGITAGGATAANSEWLSIAHDIHAQTAYNLTDYMLSTLTSLGYKAVTVGECLGDPAANWYRSSTGGGVVSSSAIASSTRASTAVGSSTRASTAASASATTKVSTDGTCEEPLDLPASTAPSAPAAPAQDGVELPQPTVELAAKPAQELALAPALLLSLSPPPQKPHRQPPRLPPRRSPPMLLAEELAVSPARALPSATAAPAQGGADLPLRTAVLDVKRHSELARKHVLSSVVTDES